MVKLADVQESNSSLKSGGSGLVAVVVGGTNGIGEAFLKNLAINTDSPKIYVVGRRQETLERLHEQLKSLNASGEYISVQADDLTLLKNVDKATEQVKSKEKKIDILFMSPGYLTFAGRSENEEGLDRITSIRYYARMRFLYNFLPLLNAAPSPRVVTVLAGGQEGAIFPEDLALRDPKHYSVVNAANVSATYTTLFLEVVHQKYPKISMVHLFPGFTKTNLLNTEHFGTVTRFLLNWIFMPIMSPLLYRSADEVGQRTLYAATNGKFRALKEGASAEGTLMAEGSDGKVGGGVYTVNDKTDGIHNDKVLQPYREQGVSEKIWDHTMQEFHRAQAA